MPSPKDFRQTGALFESDVKMPIDKVLVIENNDSDRTFYMGSVDHVLSEIWDRGHFDGAKDYRHALGLIEHNNGAYIGCVIGKTTSFKEEADRNNKTLELVDKLNEKGMENSRIAIISQDAKFVAKVESNYKGINVHQIPINTTKAQGETILKAIDAFLFQYAKLLAGYLSSPQQNNQ